MRGKRARDLLVALGALLAMGAIGVIDYLTGHEISLSVFYLLPIGFVAWRATLPLSIAAAFLSAGLWYGADMMGHEYSHPLVGVWNALVRLSIFLFAAVTLHRMRRLLDLERTLARTDGQTGVFNARAFTEILETELLRSERTNRPFSLVFLDLDNFKALNDRFGHGAGDDVLRMVGNTLKGCVRGNDVVGRLGGDEFAILITEADETQARTALERVHRALRRTLEETPWSSEIRVTASLGAIMHHGNAKVSSAALLEEADALMYRAKRLGRDQLVLGPGSW